MLRRFESSDEIPTSDFSLALNFESFHICQVIKHRLVHFVAFNNKDELFLVKGYYYCYVLMLILAQLVSISEFLLQVFIKGLNLLPDVFRI